MRSDRRTIAFIGAPGDHNSHDDGDGCHQSDVYCLYVPGRDIALVPTPGSHLTQHNVPGN